jgi:hypothetical protein
MTDVRINQLPDEASPVATDVLAIDGASGGSTRKTSIQAAVEIGRPAASQAEAEAGTNPTKAMTPLTTAQAIVAQVSLAGRTGNYSDLTGLPTLGNSAALNVGTTAGTVAAGNDSRIVNAVQTSRTLTAGAGIATIGDLSANRTIALNAASIASLLNADTAVQPNTSPTLSSVNVSGTVGASRAYFLQTSGINRWIIRASGTAESGSNVGSDLEIVRRDDAGANLGNPLSIARSTGVVTLSNAPVAPGLPNLSASVQGTGVPGLDGGRWMVWNSQTGASFDIIPTLRIDRNASPSVVGGVSGNTYQALKVNGTAGVNNQGYEWPITVELHNYALGTLNSQNVALNATAWVEANGVGETGRTWGSNLNISDKTTTANPTYGRVGLEINNYADVVGSTDNNRARCVLQLAYGTVTGADPAGGTPLHIGRGILVGSAQNNVILDRLLECSGNGTFDIGFDTTGATFSKPVYFMKEAQRIAFDGNTSGVYTRSLRYQTGELVYETASGNVFSISDTGSTATKSLDLSVTGAAQTLLTINGDPATARRIQLGTSGVGRWFVQANAVAETGANAGSNFEIVRRSDAGANLGTPVSIARSTGVVTLSNPLTIGSSQVVGTRVTGWAAATGTATRTTFATGSVTTAQLAERVKALIDDLTTHGLIGA